MLAKGSLSASDLLSLFKHPEAETNVAIHAAELMDTTVELIHQLVYTREKRYSNMTGVEDIPCSYKTPVSFNYHLE